jgi:hypothetical protein
MSEWRWYPTATTLRDGRVLVTAGSRHRQQRVFGGFRNGVAPPTADTVFRFAPVANGAWEAPVRPDADTGQRPIAREGHVAVEMRAIPGFDGDQVYFGGRGADSTLLDDTWQLKRLPNFAAPDYGYQWRKVNTSPSPPRRSEFSAISALHGNMMVIFGGLDANGNGRNDVWRLKQVDGALQWRSLDISNPSSAPSARFGHAAIYDETKVGRLPIGG